MARSGVGTNGVVKSAGRVLEVFEYFAQRREPASVGEIAKALGFPQSSTSVLMRSLHELRYMQYDGEGRLYRPTLRLALISSWLRDRQFSGAEMTALMTELRDRTGGSVVLGVRNDIDLQYIQVIPALMPVQLVMRIGQIRPLCRTAVGKALLAAHPDGMVATLVRRINARGIDERVALKPLLAELGGIRQDRIAYSANAASAGAAVIAALVPAPNGELPMAVGVGGPVDHIEAHRQHITDCLLSVLHPA